jgi:hypothetical protein
VVIALAVSVQLHATRKATEIRTATKVLNVAPEVRVALEKDLILFETDTRMKLVLGIVQALTGFALLLGLVFTWKNLQATQEKLEVDRSGQLTTRFNTATSQLGADGKEGKPNVEARLGGIYSLEWIAKDNPHLYWPVMEILTAYVRHNAPIVEGSPPKNIRTDIQAVLEVLGRSEADRHRTEGDARRKFDLRHVDLRCAEFYDAHLELTDFWGARLDKAELWGAFLKGAKLSKATLCGANLKHADLSDVDEMDGTNFEHANFFGAKIANANFAGSLGLTQAQIDSTAPARDGAKLPGDLHR